MFPTGLLNAIPNDETSPAKGAMRQHETPVKKNGAFAVYVYSTCCVVELLPSELLVLCFSSECLIKSLINPRNVTKMENTFGAWMKDTARLDDERIWVAEHFSGGSLSELDTKKPLMLGC